MVLLPNMGDDGFREFSLRKSGTSAKISFVSFRIKLSELWRQHPDESGNYSLRDTGVSCDL